MNQPKEVQNRKKGKRKRRISPRRAVLISVTVLLCMIAAISSVLVLGRFLRVKEFDVIGISRYEKTELIAASGIKRGDLLYDVDEEAVASTMLAECPYLESVTVKRKFPNRLRFEVVAKTPHWYLEISGAYYALDGALTVMAETLETRGLTKLGLPHVQSALPNEVPLFGDSDNERKRTLEIVEIVRRTSFKSRLTELDLTNRWNVTMEVDGRYRVQMGDNQDFEPKLRAVEAILAQDTLTQYEGGTIVITKGVGGYTGAFSPE